MKRNELFSDAELCMAASRLNEAMLGALPSPKECEHTFSAAFLAKMERLLKTDLRMRRSKTWRRRVAAILLAFLIGSGVFLAVNTEARAAVVNWIRQVFDEYIVYLFKGNKQSSELPIYTIGWVPDGFEVVETDKSDESEFIYYSDYQTGEIIVFECYFIDEGNSLTLNNTEGKINEETVAVQGILGIYYTDDSFLNNLTWIDEDRSVLFTLTSDLSKNDILRIANSVFLSELPK